MGWGEVYGHEGWGPALFEAGWYAVGATGDGALVRHPDMPPDAPASQVRDGRTALGWRAQCECGWQGPLWRRVAAATDADPAARRVHDPDLTVHGDPLDDLEEALRAEWLAHAGPLRTQDDALAVLEHQADVVRGAHLRMEEAVQAAHDAGASWAAIGAAAGITRQAAHERWAKVVGTARRLA